MILAVTIHVGLHKNYGIDRSNYRDFYLGVRPNYGDRKINSSYTNSIKVIPLFIKFDQDFYDCSIELWINYRLVKNHLIHFIIDDLVCFRKIFLIMADCFLPFNEIIFKRTRELDYQVLKDKNINKFNK
jgi:hypothetical protein